MLDQIEDADSIRVALGLPAETLRRLSRALERIPAAPSTVTESYGRDDPRDFIRDVLGQRATPAAESYGYVDPWTPGQDRVLASVLEHKRTAVFSGHSCGKTNIGAKAALAFLYARQDRIVVTTAPTDRQVDELLWGEIRAAFNTSKTRLPGRLLTTKLTLGERWFGIGFTAVPRKSDLSATSFQGFHAPGGVMVVVDEATGVPEEIHQGIEGICTGPNDRILAIGNPTDPSSWFVQTAKNPLWNIVHLSCLDHPNVVHRDPLVIPGAVTWEWVQERLEEYGSEDSPLFQSKVLGLAPSQSSDALISLGWIEAAQRIEVSPTDDRRGVAGGLDVAGEGEDLCVGWIIDQGQATIPEVNGRPAWHVGRDLESACDLAAQMILQHNLRAFALDDTGLGQGVTARLRRMQAEGKLPRFTLGAMVNGEQRPTKELWILPVNFGAAPADTSRFTLAKDELWWETREALRQGLIGLPTDAELSAYGLPRGNSLTQQLVTPLYDGEGPHGKVRVFDKRGAHGQAEKTKHLPAKSPDVAHALILAIHAWKRLKSNTPAPPTNVQELFEAKTREMMERGKKAAMRAKQDGNRGPVSPIRRRG